MLGWGMVPLNLLLTHESIPFCFLQFSATRLNWSDWCLLNFLWCFLTIFGWGRDAATDVSRGSTFHFCHLNGLQALGAQQICDSDIHTFCCLTVRSKNFHFSWDLLAQLCTHTPTYMHTFSRAAPLTKRRALWHVIWKHQCTQKVRRSVAKGSSSNMSLE